MNIFRIKEGIVQILDTEDFLREAAQGLLLKKHPLKRKEKEMKKEKVDSKLTMRPKTKQATCGEGLDKFLMAKYCDLRAKVVCKKGQGTTEYAILVGVLVVIAIIAITVFRPKLEELWTAISDGISSL